MKAVVLAAYGPAEGLHLQELEDPTPLPGELRVRVHRTTVTMGDTELRASNLPWLFRLPLRIWLGLFRPKPNVVLGMEFAGIVDSLGEGVEHFQLNDVVFGATSMGFGGYAELVCVHQHGTVAHTPASVDVDQVAPLPVGGLAALGYLRKGGIDSAETVLIRGASGSIGTYAVQLATHHGAQVTAVCGRDAVERMRSLGAARVIDYTAQEFDADGATYDLILDVVGKVPIPRCVRSLKPGGAYVRGTVPGLWELVQALWYRITSTKRVVLGDAGEGPEDLAHLASLVESGKVRSVIDRRYPLAQIVEAHRYVETGHKQGNVVIDVSNPG